MSYEQYADDDNSFDFDQMEDMGWWKPEYAQEALSILRSILATDERGQGQPFADAMDRAKMFVDSRTLKGPILEIVP